MTSPSILSDDQPLDPVDERLVAYLDGELDPAAREQLETELFEDESLRKRLQDLQRGWDFLEELPSATPSEQLVETTMELVVKDITKASNPSASLWTRWKIPLCVGISCVLALAMGYGAIEISRRNAFQQKMADLELAEDFNAYLDGKDTGLMRYLSMNDDWQRMIKTITDLRRANVDDASTTLVADIPIDQRRAAIDKMPRNHAATLAAQWETFTNLTSTSRDEIRATAQLVSQQTDAEKLLQTMRGYSLWVRDLPPTYIDAIQTASTNSDGEPTEDLQQAVKSAIAHTREKLPKESSRMISEETQTNIMSALKTIIDARLGYRQSPLNDAKKYFIDRAAEPIGDELMIAFLASRFMDDSQRRGRRTGPRLELTDWELEFIMQALTDEDLERLDMLAMDNEMLRLVTIKSMVAEAVVRTVRSLGLSTAENYELMTEEERMRLDLQPPNEISEQLARDSLRSTGRVFGMGPGQQGGRPGGPPGGGRDQPDPRRP